MTASAEVKAALAFARAMRRPADSLMALLDRTDRMAATLRDAPVPAAPDPTGLLAALLAPGNDAVRQRGTAQRARAAAAPDAQPRSGRRTVQPATRPIAGPAGIVSASRDGAAQTGPGQAAPEPGRPRRVGAEGLGSLRDALRQATGRAGSSELRGGPNADATAMSSGSAAQSVGQGANLAQTGSQPHRLGSDGTAPAVIRSTATPGGTARAEGQASQPSSARPGSTALVSGTVGSALAGLLDGIGAATRDQSAATGGTGQRAGREATPGTASAEPANRSGDDTAHAQPPGGSPRGPSSASGQASTPLHVPELAVTTASPTATPPERPRPRLVTPDDNPTALAEAAWRHGVDLS